MLFLISQGFFAKGQSYMELFGLFCIKNANGENKFVYRGAAPNCKFFI
jgi:hypothetical protein